MINSPKEEENKDKPLPQELAELFELPPPADGDDTVAPKFDLKHLQSIVYGAPRPPFVGDDPLIEAGAYGLDAEQAAAINEEIKQSPAYQAHLRTLHNIDRQLEEGIQRIMLEASVEFGVLQELERKEAEGAGGGGEDIVAQAERYTAEFIGRLDEEQRKRFHTP